MRESPDGVSTAATRQCAGRITAGGAAVPGAWNGPAGTAAALAIVVCGSASARRLSHDAADAASAASRQAIAKDRITIVFVADIIVSFDQLREPRRFCHIALESSAQESQRSDGRRGDSGQNSHGMLVACSNRHDRQRSAARRPRYMVPGIQRSMGRVSTTRSVRGGHAHRGRAWLFVYRNQLDDVGGGINPYEGRSA